MARVFVLNAGPSVIADEGPPVSVLAGYPSGGVVSFSDLVGRVTYPQLPIGSGTWDPGAGTTITLPRTLRLTMPDGVDGATWRPQIELYADQPGGLFIYDGGSLPTYGLEAQEGSPGHPEGNIRIWRGNGTLRLMKNIIPTYDVYGEFVAWEPEFSDSTGVDVEVGNEGFHVQGFSEGSTTKVSLWRSRVQGAQMRNMSYVPLVIGDESNTPAQLEINRVTGTATLDPMIFRFNSLSDGQDWDIVHPWAFLRFDAQDSSSPGVGTRAEFGVVATGVSGSSSALIGRTLQGGSAMRDVFRIGGTGDFLQLGPGSKLADSDFEILKATGTSTITPIVIRLHSTTNGSGYDIANPWGFIGWYSDDVSLTGAAAARGRIGMRYTGTSGGQSAMEFDINTGSGLVTFLSLGSLSPVANIGTAAKSSGSHIEVNAATGSATIAPLIIRLRTLTNAQDWLTGASNFWGAHDFYADDVSGPGTGVRARMAAYFENAVGGLTSLGFWTSGNSGLAVALTLASDLVATFAGPIQTMTGTTTMAPIRFTAGALLSAATAGRMEYDNSFYLTQSDATRRFVVLATNATKVTAAAPYANDGYIPMRIGGTTVNVMTTA